MQAKTDMATELALLGVLAALWGASYTFIKIGVETIPPITFIAARTLIAGAILLALIRWRGLSMPKDGATLWRFMVQACLNSVVPFTLIAAAERSIDAGLATILNATSPIFTFLLTALITRHESVTARKLFGVGAGIAGICLIVGTQALGGLGHQLWAQLAVIAATVCYAGAAIFGRSFRGLDPMLPAAGSMLCGAVILVPLSLAFDRPWTLSLQWRRYWPCWHCRCSPRRWPSASFSASSTRLVRSARRRRPICACRSASASASCSSVKALGRQLSGAWAASSPALRQ